MKQQTRLLIQILRDVREGKLESVLVHASFLIMVQQAEIFNPETILHAQWRARQFKRWVAIKEGQNETSKLSERQ